MNRSSIATASGILAILIGVVGYQTGVATAKLQDDVSPGAREIASVPPAFRSLPIRKSGRFGPQQEQPVVEDEQDAMIEWVIDCYDQFGPDAAEPDPASLDSCMPT